MCVFHDGYQDQNVKSRSKGQGHVERALSYAKLNVFIFYSLKFIAESKSDTQKIQNPKLWGPNVSRPLVGSKGNTLLGCLRGFAPQKLNIYPTLKTLKRPLLENRYKKITSTQAQSKC